MPYLCSPEHPTSRSAVPQVKPCDGKFDYETPYLRFILGFIGITDITFIPAGGTMRIAQGQISEQELLAPLLKSAAAAF